MKVLALSNRAIVPFSMRVDTARLFSFSDHASLNFSIFFFERLHLTASRCEPQAIALVP